MHSDLDLEDITNGVIYTHCTFAVAVHSQDDLSDPLSGTSLHEGPYDTVVDIKNKHTVVISHI